MPSRPIFGEASPDEEGQWISVSDMMAGLMVIFLFIAIVFIRNKLEETRKIAEINERMAEVAKLWEGTEDRLYEELKREFRDDLPRWNAEIIRETLSVRFKEPRVLFDTNETRIKPAFKSILSEFFPRYIGILQRDDFREFLEEIRIEGHTSSVWIGAFGEDEAYFKNMELSQGRTREVLEFCLRLPSADWRREWVRSKLTANGLSSSQLVLVAGEEHAARSRRVEFRVRTNAAEQIARILEYLK